MAQGTGHLLDQNTVHLWRLDETNGNFLDAANPATHQLFIKGGVTRVMGLASGRAGYLDGTGALQVTSPATLSDPQKLVYPQGNYTVEMWLKLNGEPPSGVCLFTIGRYNTYYYSLTYATNRSLSLNYAIPSNFAYSAFTTGAGALPKDRWFHLAIRKTVENPAEPDVLLRTNTFDVFIDGVKVHTVTGKANMGGTPSGTGDGGTYWNSMLYTFGSYPRAFPGEAVTLTMVGWLDDIHISNTARTDGELLADSQRGLPTGKDTSGYGHGVDANTLALWRFNESTVTDGAFDEVSGVVLPAVGSPPLVATAKVAGGRQLTSATTYFEGPAPADIQAALLGSFTWEGWVRPDAAFASGGATQSIWSIGLSGVVWLANINLDRASQTLGFTWTNGANNFINSGYGATLRMELGVWTHVAVRKTWNGSSNIIEFFLNGTKRATSPSLVNPASITSPLMDFGRVPQVTGINFVGSIDDVRLSKVARTDQEIWNSFLSAAPAKGHAIDADTLALWRCNEAVATDPFVDEMGRYTLTQTGSPSVATGRIGSARGFNGTNQYAAGLANQEAQDAFLNDMSWEGWIYLDPTYASGSVFPSIYALSYCASPFGGSANTYRLPSIAFYKDARQVYLAWVTSGPSNWFSPPAETYYFAAPGVWFHYAFTKKKNVDGGSTYDIYVNGKLHATWTGTAAEEPLTPPSMPSWYVARHERSVADYFMGRVDDIRVSKKARTHAEILASYHQGLQYCTYVPGGVRSISTTAPADLDADTRFLWNLDEATGTETAIDEKGTYPLTTAVGTPVTVTGKYGNARSFVGTSYLMGPADDGCVTKVKAKNWTLDGWFYVESSVETPFFGLGNANAASTDSVSPQSWALTFSTSNGAFSIGTSHGYSSGGAYIPQGRWFHLAVACYSQGVSGFPAGYNLRIFVDGVAVDTRSLNSVLPDPGPYFWFLGRSRRGLGYTAISGGVRADRVRFHNVARTDDQIYAYFATPPSAEAPVEPVTGTVTTSEIIIADPTTRGHTLDPYTVAMWRLEETNYQSPAADECGNYPLAVGASHVMTSVGTGRIGRARVFANAAGATPSLYTAAGSIPYLIDLFVNGSYTIEGWVDGGAGNAGKALLVCGAVGETPETNFIASLNSSFLGSGIYAPGTFWEYASGTNVSLTSTVGHLDNNGRPFMHHYAVTVEVTGATRKATLYWNGATVATASGLTPATSGTSALLTLGTEPNGANPWGGAIDEVRISNKARTQAEILESYQRGINQHTISFSSTWHDGTSYVGDDGIGYFLGSVDSELNPDAPSLAYLPAARMGISHPLSTDAPSLLEGSAGAVAASVTPGASRFATGTDIMPELKQNTVATLPVRLVSSSGTTVNGKTYSDITASVIKANGTLTTWTPTNGQWQEAGAGAFASSGVYLLTLPASVLDVLGPFAFAVSCSGAETYTAVGKVVASEEADTVTGLSVTTAALSSTATTLSAAISDTTTTLNTAIGGTTSALSALTAEVNKPLFAFESGGETVAPTVTLAQAPRRTQLRVRFSEAVQMDTGASGALNPSNYLIGGLTVSAVSPVSDREVLLTTSVQTPGLTYTLTVQNIVDLNDNVIGA